MQFETGSVSSLIEMLFLLRRDSETYKNLLGQLLEHEDLCGPEDLVYHVNKFVGSKKDQIDDFRFVLLGKAKASSRN